MNVALRLLWRRFIAWSTRPGGWLGPIDYTDSDDFFGLVPSMMPQHFLRTPEQQARAESVASAYDVWAMARRRIERCDCRECYEGYDGAGSSKGRTADFDSANLGSIPSPAVESSVSRRPPRTALDSDVANERHRRAEDALRTSWGIDNRYPGIDAHLALARDVLALEDALAKAEELARHQAEEIDSYARENVARGHYEPLGHDAAAVRLLNARGSIRAAFDSLDTGITFEELTLYIKRDFHAKALAVLADDPERFHARLVGLVAGAALTIVEADRRQAVDARFRQTGGVA